MNHCRVCTSSIVRENGMPIVFDILSQLKHNSEKYCENFANLIESNHIDPKIVRNIRAITGLDLPIIDEQCELIRKIKRYNLVTISIMPYYSNQSNYSHFEIDVQKRMLENGNQFVTVHICPHKFNPHIGHF